MGEYQKSKKNRKKKETVKSEIEKIAKIANDREEI